jgi:hypothetical protein
VAVVQDIDTGVVQRPATVNIEFTEEADDSDKAQSYSLLLTKISGYQQETRKNTKTPIQQTANYTQSEPKAIDSLTVTKTIAEPKIEPVKKKINKTSKYDGVEKTGIQKPNTADSTPKANVGLNQAQKINVKNELMLGPAQKIDLIKAAANDELKAIVQNIPDVPEVHEIKVEQNKGGLVLLKLSVNDQVDELQKIFDGVSLNDFDNEQMDIIRLEVNGLATYINTAEGRAASSKSDPRLVQIRDRLVSDLVLKVGAQHG